MEAPSSLHQTGASPLSLSQLALALLAPALILLLSIYLKLEFATKIGISVARSGIQLLFAGCILLSYIFAIKSPILVVGYLFAMALIASFEVISRRTLFYDYQYIDSLVAIMLGGGVVGAYSTIVVFNPHPC